MSLIEGGKTMEEETRVNAGRRRFLGTGLTILGAAAALGPVRVLAQAAPEKSAAAGEGMPPTEDLMREHGVLRRVLLVYEELHRRLQGGQEFGPEVLSGAAGIIKKFIEAYHEKLEEDHLFPRFVKAGVLVDLVQVLKEQHQAGRRVTEFLLANATADALNNQPKRQELAAHLHAFWRLYRPHAAREDTVLFPAFRGLVPVKEFQELGEKFEDTEQEKFGKDGFEKMVAQVAGLEKTLGIEDLAKFTPKL
jgi:hemerythrin-like domain-containing protein